MVTGDFRLLASVAKSRTKTRDRTSGPEGLSWRLLRELGQHQSDRNLTEISDRVLRLPDAYRGSAGIFHSRREGSSFKYASFVRFVLQVHLLFKARGQCSAPA